MKRLVCSPLVLASLLPAQTLVSPALRAGAEANNYDYQPFGDPRTPFRYLQVHDDLAGRPMTLHGMSFRREGLAVSTAYPAFTLVVDVFVSHATTSAGAVGATFDQNHGPDRTQVATSMLVNFPATTSGAVPRPFEYRIPFAQAFPWNGAGSLCWEVRVLSRTNTGYVYFDLEQGSITNPLIAVANLGTGCKATGQSNPIYLSSTSTMNWPQGNGQVTWFSTSGPANTPGILALGTSNTSFGGIPLPFEIPTTRGGASGACFLYNSFAFVLPVLDNASGNITQSANVPATQEFYNARLFGQLLFPDAAANAIGVVSSNQVECNWVAPYAALPVGRVYLASSLGASGLALSRSGLVVQFD